MIRTRGDNEKMEMMKKAYLPAEIEIVPLNAGDLLATSGGFDGNDNWADDIFPLD